MSPSQFLLTKSHKSDSNLPIRADIPKLWKDGHPSFAPYWVGQKVLKKVIKKGNLLSNKLSPRYDGPYEVVSANQNQVTYTIKRISNGQIKKV